MSARDLAIGLLFGDRGGHSEFFHRLLEDSTIVFEHEINDTYSFEGRIYILHPDVNDNTFYPVMPNTVSNTGIAQSDDMGNYPAATKWTRYDDESYDYDWGQTRKYTIGGVGCRIFNLSVVKKNSTPIFIVVNGYSTITTGTDIYSGYRMTISNVVNPQLPAGVKAIVESFIYNRYDNTNIESVDLSAVEDGYIVNGTHYDFEITPSLFTSTKGSVISPQMTYRLSDVDYLYYPITIELTYDYHTPHEEYDSELDKNRYYLSTTNNTITRTINVMIGQLAPNGYGFYTDMDMTDATAEINNVLAAMQEEAGLTNTYNPQVLRPNEELYYP